MYFGTRPSTVRSSRDPAAAPLWGIGIQLTERKTDRSQSMKPTECRTQTKIPQGAIKAYGSATCESRRACERCDRLHFPADGPTGGGQTSAHLPPPWGPTQIVRGQLSVSVTPGRAGAVDPSLQPSNTRSSVTGCRPSPTCGASPGRPPTCPCSTHRPRCAPSMPPSSATSPSTRSKPSPS